MKNFFINKIETTNYPINATIKTISGDEIFFNARAQSVAYDENSIIEFSDNNGNFCCIDFEKVESVRFFD